tara:strand:- start:210 stop:779 length:570 start_codon:yes stop_codon:yes gene_type:complete
MSFNEIAKSDNSQGLMNPTFTRDISMMPTRDQQLLQIINENSFDQLDQFHQQDAQANAELVNADRPDSKMEDVMSEYTNVQLDPSLYKSLEVEASRNDNNYMNHESEDMVNLVRLSHQSYQTEENLFTRPPAGSSGDMSGLEKLLRELTGNSDSMFKEQLTKMRKDEQDKIDQLIRIRRNTARETQQTR